MAEMAKRNRNPGCTSVTDRRPNSVYHGRSRRMILTARECPTEFKPVPHFKIGGLAMRPDRCVRIHLASVAAAAVFGTLAATSGFADPPAGKLAPADIQTTFFTGQPFTAATPSNIKFKMTFAADGKMKRQPVGPGNKGEGTWKLSKDGFCTSWNGGKSSCFTVVAAGENKWSIMKGSTMLATWSK
jgi:hypothetical protein